jgi:hypothetical protein
MQIKNFKQFINEATSVKEAQEIFNEFKAKLESKYQEVNPNFKVLGSSHLFDRVVERLNNKNELTNIFNKVYDRFFKSTFQKGFSTQIDPGAFKLSPSKEWEIQHKIFIDPKNFRCIVYTVKPIIVGKDVNGIASMNFITINDLNRDGKNNPAYRNTTAITESIDWDTINEIED